MTRTGIYIHIPFCESRCSYCDFFSTVPKAAEIKTAYGAQVVAVLKKELATVRAEEIVSLYIGGGTPSTMPGRFFTAVGRALTAAGIDTKKIEFTVEANPADITAPFLRTLKKCGVNRLSLGTQSADDAVLKAMGRRASREMLAKVLPLARKEFDNISYDIIYGFGKRPRDLAAELGWLFELAVPDHVSTYCYTRPERRKVPPVAREERIETEEEAIHRFLAASRFTRYEVSNWARRGFESVHNRLYWSWDRYIGIGAGAHGFTPADGVRYHYPESVMAFIKDPVPVVERSPRDVKMREFVMMGLRTKEGIRRTQFKKLFGVDIAALMSVVTRERFIDAGYATLTKRRLAATVRGFDLLNSFIGALFDDIERYARGHER
ncbi:MAG TPA: coproporphyrinogen-III oxidase family protein [bacterium]|nr:coproporphyrinogen-III oxidase family protein [bacterium]